MEPVRVHACAGTINAEGGGHTFWWVDTPARTPLTFLTFLILPRCLNVSVPPFYFHTQVLPISSKHTLVLPCSMVHCTVYKGVGYRYNVPVFLVCPMKDGLVIQAVAAAGVVLIVLARRRRLLSPPPPRPPPLPHPAPVVKRCASPHELLSICRLRYMVYVGELKRSNYSYVDDIREILEDPLDSLDSCINLYVPHPEERNSGSWKEFLVRHAKAASADAPPTEEVEDDFVPSIGCARVHCPSPDKYAGLFANRDAGVWGDLAARPTNFAFFSRFMVHLKYRGKQLGCTDAMYAASAIAARCAGARILLLNCTPALAPMYEVSRRQRTKAAEGTGSVGALLARLPPHQLSPALK